MTQKRQDGWYWVKPGGHCNFCPAHWDHRGWLIGLSVYEVPIVVQEIGGRIPTPDELEAK